MLLTAKNMCQSTSSKVIVNVMQMYQSMVPLDHINSHHKSSADAIVLTSQVFIMCVLLVGQ